MMRINSKTHNGMKTSNYRHINTHTHTPKYKTLKYNEHKMMKMQPT